MTDDFYNYPFYLNELNVYCIHRALNPNHFFIKFILDKKVSDGFLIQTMKNGFAEYVTRCSTIWNPEFEITKWFLVLGTDVQKDFSEVERKELMECDQEIIEFGNLIFNEEESRNSFVPKSYNVIIDNKNKLIKLIHTHTASSS